MRLIRSAARVVLSLAVTCGALIAGAWAGGIPPIARAEAPMPSRARIAEPYPRSEPGEIRIGDSLAMNGQRMQLSAFTTPDPPQRVVQFYEEVFRSRGLIPIAAAADQLGHVSVFDPQDGLQRFVTVVPERAGRSLVLLGATDPREFAVLRNASAASYPVPEHRAFIGYESHDGRVRGESGQFVSNLSAAEVVRFYRSRLATRGFTERPESGPALLAFVNGTHQISVAVQSLEYQRGAAVFVTRTEEAQ